MAHHQRLETGQSSFEQTPFVVPLRFVTVCVAEVSLHAGNPVGKTAYSPLYTGIDEAHDIFTPCDVVVGIDLNLHESPLLANTIPSRDPDPNFKAEKCQSDEWARSRPEVPFQAPGYTPCSWEAFDLRERTHAN